MVTYLKTKTEKCNVLPIGRMGEGANELCVGVGWQVTLREDKEFASFLRLLPRGWTKNETILTRRASKPP